MGPKEAFAIFLAVRVASIFLIQSWYVPDEYWQSLEVAHKLTFGYGHLTWEWTQGIRSYLHPLLFTLLYKLLSLLRIDWASLLIVGPRLLQACISAYADLRFWHLCDRSKWSIFVMVTSWFWLYTGSRTLINTLETCLTTIALSYFPFQAKNMPDNNKFIWVIGFTCALRPTAFILFTPLIIYHLTTSKLGLMNNLLTRYVPAAIIVTIVTTATDSYMHGSLIITWFEFFKVNVWEGVSAHYGSQPWHFYLSQGLPVVYGPFTLPFLASAVRVLRFRRIMLDELVILATITSTVTVYSFFGHKEFRFLMPLMPLGFYITATYLKMWSVKANQTLLWLAALTLLVSNLVPAIYMGLMFQRGTLDVMPHLRDIAQKGAPKTPASVPSFLFLMPCHSAPLYSHLHVNVTARFLTCNPNLAKAKGYVDEADHFYRNPTAWFRNNYPPGAGGVPPKYPSHIVAFDVLEQVLVDLLSRYKPIQRIFHTKYPIEPRIGKYVVLYERIDFS